MTTTSPYTDTNAALAVFSNPAFGSVRIVDKSGTPWFVASDIAKVLGYEDPSRAVLQHCKKTNKITQIGETQGRVNTPPVNINIIPESDVYRLVMRSRLPNAVAFQDWICDEVIPSIRKTGSYSGLPVPSALPNFSDPVAAARAWADEREAAQVAQSARLALEQKMEEVKPKVVFAEAIEVAKDAVLVAEMAKLIKQATGYDMGQNRFFDFLRDGGYLHKHGSQRNLPTQRSIDAGWMVIKEGTRSGTGGEMRITKTPKITGRGQVYFINLFKSKTAPLAVCA